MKKHTVNRDCLKDLAERYLKSNPSENFIINDYFIRRCKKSNNKKYSTMHGEAQSADRSKLREWFNQYDVVLNEYGHENVFNLDETALFYQKSGK